MGTSNWQNISYNINLVRKINPASILDIGVGFGRWGILFREFLEIWDSGRYDGKWERVIEGIEVYPGYLKEYHSYFYDKIYVTDALEFLKGTDRRYDLINCGDVVEHFPKEQGRELLELSMQKGRFVLVNVPIGKHWEQAPVGNNPYEAHRSVWYNNDFIKYKHCRIKSFTDFTLRDFSVILLSKDRIKFDKRFGKYFALKNFLSHKLGLRWLVKKLEKGTG